MAKKFDTNPLDPEFPNRIRERAAERQGLDERQTRKFADFGDSEKRTKSFADHSPEESVGTPPICADNPAPPRRIIGEIPPKKKSVKIGTISLPENIATMLPYLPISVLGIVAAVVELIFVPRSEPKIRYHAAQGLAAQIGFWVVIWAVRLFGNVTDFSSSIANIVSVSSIIILGIFAIKAFQGKPIHIETVQGLTDWFEEKISPKD